jgi:hypothetical protein
MSVRSLAAAARATAVVTASMLAVLVVAGCGSTAPLDREAQEMEMAGDWTATGRVAEATNWANEQAGEVLSRAWHIERNCSEQPCRLMLTRQTAYQPLTAELRWVGGHWETAWNQSTPCVSPAGPQGVAIEHSEWRFDYTSSGIEAVEHVQSETPGCGASSGVTVWIAKRASDGGEPTA